MLSAAFIAEGMKIVSAGTNPVQLVRGMEKTVQHLVKELAKMSVEIRTDKDLANVASVSAGRFWGVPHGGLTIYPCMCSSASLEPCSYWKSSAGGIQPTLPHCIHAGNNPDIGQLIADAMAKVGRQGVVTMEESKTAEDNLVFVEGMQFDRGYYSPYFVTDPERMVGGEAASTAASVSVKLV